MERRPVGLADLTFSEVALGTWSLSGEARGVPLDEGSFVETVQAAADGGVTTFDVSPLWADGGAERALRKALEGRPPDAFELISRGGVRRREGSGEVVVSHERDALVADCQGSLDRLGRERIDLFLLQGLPEDPEDDAWRYAVEELRRQGKIGFWGVSAGDLDTARRALRAGATAVCLPFNLVANDALRELESELVVYKAGVLARSPLAYGLLGMQWLETQNFPPGDHRRDRWTPADLRVRVRQSRRLRFMARGAVGSPAEAAVRWVLSHDAVTAVLVGPSRLAQLRDLLRASGPPPYLPDEDLGRIDQALVDAGLAAR